ncbi:MAG: hypothetical protein LUG62_03225 [Clostridiales bacterium]|nr:hypothetical protein [Clostridiales bacterium]
MQMIEEEEIGQVQISSSEILFTDKDNTIIYKTGVMDDPTLTERLYELSAVFSSEIVEEMSPLLSFFLYWILPILVFIGIGQLLTRRLTKNYSGGENSMIFNMELSTDLIWIQSFTRTVLLRTGSYVMSVL